MIDNKSLSYELQLSTEINKISPNAYDKIDEITTYPLSVGVRILKVLVEYACLGQNMGPIMLARNQIKKIPLKWIFQYIPKVAVNSICFDDEWEYRRLLELILDTVPELLNWVIEKGINSTNEEVREAAEEFYIASEDDSFLQNFEEESGMDLDWL